MFLAKWALVAIYFCTISKIEKNPYISLIIKLLQKGDLCWLIRIDVLDRKFFLHLNYKIIRIFNSQCFKQIQYNQLRDVRKK